jgi:hypothetical protein
MLITLPRPRAAIRPDDDVERMDVAEELRVHRVVPRLRGEIAGRVTLRGTRGIHEHIDRPERGLDLVDHACRLRGIDEVGRERDGAMLRVRDSRERRVEIRPAARNERDARTFACECLSAREADALARTGDDDNLTGKSEIHLQAPRQDFANRFSRLAITAGHAFSKYALVFAHSSPSPYPKLRSVSDVRLPSTGVKSR